MSTLAQGGKLNAETFADFVARLKHDCRGEGVHDHCTADAIFIVEKKVIVGGIDKDYTDQWLIYCDDRSWYSPKDYWDDADEELQSRLDELAAEECGEPIKFLELEPHEQWKILEDLDDHTVTGYTERWDYVNSHFTKDAAEAFIKRKQHDYRDGLRVYVDSQYLAWEFNAIKTALMDGTLTYQSVSVPLTPTDLMNKN